MTDTDQTNAGQEPVGDQERDESQATAEQAEREERALLMQRARLLGLTISNNIGLETLRKRIKDAMDGTKNAVLVKDAVPELVAPGTPKALNSRQKLRNEATKLVRIHIVNLDPKKKDLQGEIITVANDLIGTVRKFVPFGEITEKGYHVPNIIYKMLKKRKFLNIRTRRGPKGEQIVEQNWAQEFAITVLPPLTKEELHDLAVAQAAAGSVG